MTYFASGAKTVTSDGPWEVLLFSKKDSGVYILLLTSTHEISILLVKII